MVREEILQALLRVEAGENTLEEVLNRKMKNKQDQGLYREILKGIYRHLITIDYFIHSFLKKKNQKLHLPIQMILRMSFYQWMYLDKIPAHAIVYEGVELAKKVGHRGSVGFVNAILRKATAQKLNPEALHFNSLEEEIHIKYSLPVEWTRYFIKNYGEDWTLDFAKNSVKIPDLHLRVNTNKISSQDLKNSLKKEGINFVDLRGVCQGLEVLEGNIFETEEFKQGLFYVQDKAAMMVAEFALEKEEMIERVLDVCGAPGGKSIGMSFLNPDLEIFCCDVTKEKVDKIKENLHRLDLNQVKALKRDGRHLSPEERNKFDLVLLDAPCSGLGLLRRKPEIKYNRTLKDMKSLVKLQRQLLDTSSQCVKLGGKLVYSTCTLSKEENEMMMEDFLIRHKGFDLLDQKVLNLNEETDGFKMFKLVKKC